MVIGNDIWDAYYKLHDESEKALKESKTYGQNTYFVYSNSDNNSFNTTF